MKMVILGSVHAGLEIGMVLHNNWDSNRSILFVATLITLMKITCVHFIHTIRRHDTWSSETWTTPEARCRRPDVGGPYHADWRLTVFSGFIGWYMTNSKHSCVVSFTMVHMEMLISKYHIKKNYVSGYFFKLFKVCVSVCVHTKDTVGDVWKQSSWAESTQSRETASWASWRGNALCPQTCLRTWQVWCTTTVLPHINIHHMFPEGSFLSVTRPFSTVLLF